MSAELREFLRTRRARLSPAEAGLPPHLGPRRVPGLRREEVAWLAGMSVDYYVRLEQGRNPGVSTEVLDAVARALRLDRTERAQLFDLVRCRGGRPQPAQRVNPALDRVLTALTGPAMILGHRLDVLAINPLGTLLYTDFADRPAGERNLVRHLFTDPAARERTGDWPSAARATVGALRRYGGCWPGDELLAELVAEMSSRDADFRRWWAAHDVLAYTHGDKVYRLPGLGELTLHFAALTLPDDPDQTLYAYTAEPGSPTEAALRRAALTTPGTAPSGSPAPSAAAATPAHRPAG
ncbi:helix-turn-helix transcriptional regulator [Crossiella sp. CA-258035]|uniref:helix-turn-helix transcriptional regulator n=1 Tax=Crossiella sp. CA-258035 TaxID=2981138 RepID=UPI0024BC426A|nr:helix-turn-helix transcriptional regulator [Crossiella sp. CA-258035]WHT22430.1 helix-turn-helix transcriptional regulator [Crossiella sp. CA-258035]